MVCFNSKLQQLNHDQWITICLTQVYWRQEGVGGRGGGCHCKHNSWQGSGVSLRAPGRNMFDFTCRHYLMQTEFCQGQVWEVFWPMMQLWVTFRQWCKGLRFACWFVWFVFFGGWDEVHGPLLAYLGYAIWWRNNVIILLFLNISEYQSFSQVWYRYMILN